MSNSKIVCDKPGLFEGLSEEEVNKFTADMKRMKFKKGTQIITENELSSSLFFLCKGRVEIKKDLKNPDTPAAQLSILEPGDFFGEMGVIDAEPRSASVLALDDVELLIIPKDDFIALSFKHPSVMFNLIRTLSDRLRNTNERFVTLMDNMISQNRLMAIGMAASKIIHDIKTPLTVIVLTAQLIENLFPGSEEFTQSIVKQTRLIDQLVREILDFSRGVETTPLIQKVDLIRFFEDFKEINDTALKGRNIAFVVDNKVNDYVYFDEAKIRRVLMNLIKNASEAMDSNKEIKLAASMNSGWLQISVIDNGPGIPVQMRENIFEPFITNGKLHGTGLGLPICRKLVQEHKGRLEYIPLEPTGCRFDIRIPQTLK
ncbi:MAG: cyclic nucleotide-binding domain-containing protein [Candidatus Cloacimonetes bacterium]|jgi:signal transduction histidine kinase|nr:cyclic nucleotide-binding domain-containing protein [Candidatus Cloacimonadota bacterium]MDY0172532.1 ATP-binding protein [Candidatus Cloacimonadaceae bacterium]